MTTTAEQEKAKNDPSTRSQWYERMAPQWHKITTIIGGTAAMRAAGTTYLHKNEKESEENYKHRKETSTLKNFVEITLANWTGKPFSNPMKVEGQSAELEALFSNIDNQGNDISIVCRDWFNDGLAKSFSHMYIDSPKKKTEEELGRTRTKQDDIDEKIRPYWVPVKPENLIFAHCEYEDGVEILKQVRIYEEKTEIDGFAEVTKCYIRVMEPGRVRIFEKREENKKIIWVLVEDRAYDLTFIPLVTFYSNRSGFMEGKSPVSDLADLNIEHWNSYSEQRSVLTVARFPMLAGSGVGESDTVEIGPKKFLRTSDPQGEFYYVEHTGAAIEAGRQDLQDLEESMMAYGADYLKARPGGETATGRALDSAESLSPLQEMTMKFQYAVALALNYTAQWMGQEFKGTVTLNTDFSLSSGEAVEIDALKEARRNRDISRKRLLTEYHERGILSDSFDFDENEQELEDEMQAALSAMATVDIDPFQEDNPEDDKGKGGKTDDKGNPEDDKGKGKGKPGEKTPPKDKKKKPGKSGPAE